MPIWSEQKTQVTIRKGDEGPPRWGRWLVYVNGDYRGSAPDKAGARKLARDIERCMANAEE